MTTSSLNIKPTVILPMGIARKSISNQYNNRKPTPPITLIPNKKFALEYTSNDYGLDKIIMLRYLWL
ncbi:hypothetical protein ACNR9Q_08785 [Maribacter sp. X9]|uniref:hypothetical protein n=1 Tax=Maribacter sp. X9 TaxID=3402159 RepID=UPI003AF3E7E8